MGESNHKDEIFGTNEKNQSIWLDIGYVIKSPMVFLESALRVKYRKNVFLLKLQVLYRKTLLGLRSQGVNVNGYQSQHYQGS